MQITMMVPAQHKRLAQILIFTFYKSHDLIVDVDMIFSVPVGPDRSSITNYIHSMDLTQELLDLQIEDQKRSCLGFDWVHPELTTDADILLNCFSITLEKPNDLLKRLGLKLC